MESIGGMTPTGRRISGPASDLIELDSDSGLKHTAIQFNEGFWEHAGITSSLTVVLGFLESPMVTGLVELTHHEREQGAFVYPTGSVWSVAEVIRTMANAGRVPGIRAGLELCYVAGQVLMEAGETGPAQGIYSHGGLTPWRLMLKADGQVQLIGYGLPQVEVLQYLEDNAMMPREDSFRYCPPERIEGQGEDVTSDLFSLALIGLEMMVGKPVYDGLVDDILQKATRAEGAYTLYKWRDKLPDSVREVLGKAIKYDPDTRYQDPNAFVHDVHDILSSVDAEGPSLMEVMETVRRAPKRGRALMGGQTAAISKEQLKRMSEEMDDAEGRGVSAPSRPRSDDEPEEDESQARWGKVSRRGRRGEEKEEEKPGRSSSGRGRRSRGGRDKDEGRSSSGRSRLRRSRGGSSDEDESPRSRLRRSRGGSSDDDGGRGRSRLRRSRGDDDEEESSRSRLRRSRGDDDDGGRSRLRRSRASDEDEAPSRPERPRRKGKKKEEESASGAAALLAKLRSSSGATSKPEAPTPGMNEPDDGPDTEAPPPKAAPAKPSPAAKESARPAPVPTPAVTGTSDAPEAPPAIAGHTDKATGAEVTVRIGEAERDLVVLGETVADVAARWTALLSVPTDLSGQLAGWYCIEQGGERIKGSASAAVIDTSRIVELVFVPNTTRVVTIEIEGDEPTRFRAPVGMAVPAGSLLAHLVGWLELPQADYAIHADGTELGAARILGEAAPEVEVLKVNA